MFNIFECDCGFDGGFLITFNEETRELIKRCLSCDKILDKHCYGAVKFGDFAVKDGVNNAS